MARFVYLRVRVGDLHILRLNVDNLNQDLDLKTGPLAECLDIQPSKLCTKHNYLGVISFLEADYQQWIRLGEKKVD